MHKHVSIWCGCHVPTSIFIFLFAHMQKLLYFCSAKAYVGDSWGGNGWVQPWLLPVANGYRLCVYAVATATITPCTRSLCTYIVIKRRLSALVLVVWNPENFLTQNKKCSKRPWVCTMYTILVYICIPAWALLFVLVKGSFPEPQTREWARIRVPRLFLCMGW